MKFDGVAITKLEGLCTGILKFILFFIKRGENKIFQIRHTRGEGRKPGVFMNPPVIPTCIAFWPGEKELNLHIKHTTLEPNNNQLFLNLGRVSH